MFFCTSINYVLVIMYALARLQKFIQVILFSVLTVVAFETLVPLCDET